MTWVRCEQCTASPVGVLFWDYSDLFLEMKSYRDIKIDIIFGISIIELGLQYFLGIFFLSYCLSRDQMLLTYAKSQKGGVPSASGMHA